MMPSGVIVTDMKGNILNANPSYQKMVGFALDELKVLKYQDITPDKWHELEKEMILKAFNVQHVKFKKEYMRENGTVFPVKITVWLTIDEKGVPVGTTSIVQDVSNL